MDFMKERITEDAGEKFAPSRYGLKSKNDVILKPYGTYDLFFEITFQVLQKLGAYEDIGTPEECKEAVGYRAEYEALEEQGKLLKLPCAVGDTVYEVQELRKRIQPYTIIVVQVSNCGNLYGWELKDGKGIYSNVHGFSEYAIGKQVFLTLEGAEAALKELEGKEV